MKRKQYLSYVYGFHRVGQKVCHTGSVRGGHARKQGVVIYLAHLSIYLIY